MARGMQRLPAHSGRALKGPQGHRESRRDLVDLPVSADSTGVEVRAHEHEANDGHRALQGGGHEQLHGAIARLQVVAQQLQTLASKGLELTEAKDAPFIVAIEQLQAPGDAHRSV